MTLTRFDSRPLAEEKNHLAAADLKRDVKKLSILLPSKLHQRARRHSMSTDQTLTQLVTTLLVEYLDQHEAPRRSVE